LNWNTQVLLKFWLAYPLFCCTCVLISVCNDRVFGTGADGVAWVCGGSFEMTYAFRHKLNLKNNLEIICNYVLVEFWR